MKLSHKFNPVYRNAETPKDMILDDGEGGQLVFKIRGLLSQAFRQANESKYKKEEDKGRALIKALIVGLPEGLELEDGTPATIDNLDALIEENPWLIGQVIEFAKEHPQFDPKPLAQ